MVRIALIVVVLVFVFVPWPAAGAAPATQPAALARPNVVFLFADDQRYDTIGACGNSTIRTPNLDRLARGGVSFTQTYIMGSMRPAVCMPSRAMLMTGRSLFKLRKEGGFIPPEQETFPEAFRRAGYHTFAVGKWHSDKASFMRSFADGAAIFFGGMSNHWKVPVFDYDPTGKYSAKDRHRGAAFSSTLFTDAAVRFLREYHGDAPFLLYVSYTAPHDPRTPPGRFATLYDPATIPLPPNFLPEHPFDNGELKIRDERLAPFPRTPEVVRRHIADYYGMISHLDAELGRVLETLGATGRDRNTIVVFTSDNGLAVGQHGLLGKQNLYEHSVRVPMIVTGPGIAAGRRVTGLCYLHDIGATLCDLAGVVPPAGMMSRSLRPALQSPKAPLRKAIYLAYRDFQRGVRSGRWKLIVYVVDGKRTVQLFDLEEDPWETRNLADDPAQAERVAQLTAMLRAWSVAQGDSFAW